MLGFRGRAQQQANRTAQVGSQNQVATVGPVGSRYDSAISTPATMPKVTQIVSRSSLPSLPFAGGSSPAQVEFDIPQSIGRLTDLVAEFSITFSTADVSGCTIQTVPSAFLVSKVEVLYGPNVLETIDAAEIWNESCQLIDDNQFALKRSLWNISSTGGFNTAFSLATEAVTSQKIYYLPLNANFFVRMAPFVKGFKGRWSVRLTLNTDITVSTYKVGTTTSNTAVVTLDNLRLFATEQYLGDAVEAAQMAAHERGCVYKCLLRKKFQSGVYTTIPNTSETSIQLATLKGDSAAIIVYVRKNTEAITDILSHYELLSIGLTDDKNAQITAQLPAKVVESEQAKLLPCSSVMINNSPSNNYILGHTANLHQALSTGRFSGGLSYSGLESVVVKPVSTLSDVRLCAVSLEYANLSVQGGNASLVRGS